MKRKKLLLGCLLTLFFGITNLIFAVSAFYNGKVLGVILFGIGALILLSLGIWEYSEYKTGQN